MPLLDHFHAPLFPQRRWESFHARWAGTILDYLVARLRPPRFFAEMQIHLGTRIEAEFEKNGFVQESRNGTGGGLQLATSPPVTFVMPMVFPDDIEIQVLDGDESRRLLGVIELISPANKDREEHRRAFASKCLAYLQKGVGLIIIDTVTSRSGCLHNELVDIAGQPEAYHLPNSWDLYAVAYQPSRVDEQNQLRVWTSELSVGRALPTLPFALRDIGYLDIDFEETYTETRSHTGLAESDL